MADTKGQYQAVRPWDVGELYRQGLGVSRTDGLGARRVSDGKSRTDDLHSGQPSNLAILINVGPP